MSILDNITRNVSNISDEVICNDMLMGSKGAAAMYLSAILESATPELKSMYSGSLNQILEGHAATTAIAVNHDWYKPYEKPEQQLADAYKDSVSIIDYKR